MPLNQAIEILPLYLINRNRRKEKSTAFIYLYTCSKRDYQPAKVPVDFYAQMTTE